MRTKGSRLRWIACIATLLLLCIVGSDRPEMGTEQAPLAASQCAFVAEEIAVVGCLTDVCYGAEGLYCKSTLCHLGDYQIAQW